MKQTLFNKNFISLWTWDLFTLLVVKLRGIIIPLVILNATSSSQTVASVSLVQQVVIFSLMIPVGAWVERRRKIKTAVIFRLLYGVGLFLLAVVLTVGGLNITLMTGLLVFVSVCGMVASTAFNAMIPHPSSRPVQITASQYLSGRSGINRNVNRTCYWRVFTGERWCQYCVVYCFRCINYLHYMCDESYL